MSTSMKRIYPGNWVNQLSTYQGQPVIALPGRRAATTSSVACLTGVGGGKQGRKG